MQPSTRFRDSLLFGRKTFELFEKFWKEAVDDARTAPDPHRPEHRTREHGAIGMWMNDATKFVFSRTLQDLAWKNAHVIHQLDSDTIEELKRRPGKDMMVFGSGSIVAQLTRLGLIDEYQMLVCPIFIGSGRTLLGDVSRSVRLELLESQTYESGDVLLRYARRQ